MLASPVARPAVMPDQPGQAAADGVVAEADAPGGPADDRAASGRRGRDGPRARIDSRADDGVAGFSLVEMLVVLAVLALTAGLGLSSLQAIVPSQRLNATTEAIAAEIALLQAEALRTGRTTRLVFEPDLERFLSSRPGARAIPTEGWRTVVETSAASRVEPGEIRFRPDGGSTGGRIVLSGSGLARSLAVGRATGAIRRTEVAP